MFYSLQNMFTGKRNYVVIVLLKIFNKQRFNLDPYNEEAPFKKLNENKTVQEIWDIVLNKTLLRNLIFDKTV